MTRSRPLIVILALTMATLTVGCHPTKERAIERIGVTIGSAGIPRLLYISCGGELVTQIRMVEFAEPVLTGDEKAVWEIDSKEGSPIPNNLPIGAKVAGFRTVVKMDALDSNQTYSLFVHSSLQTIAGVGFSLSELQSGAVRVPGGESEPMQDFIDNADSQCD